MSCVGARIGEKKRVQLRITFAENGGFVKREKPDLTALVGTFRLANAYGVCDVRFPLARACPRVSGGMTTGGRGGFFAVQRGSFVMMSQLYA